MGNFFSNLYNSIFKQNNQSVTPVVNPSGLNVVSSPNQGSLNVISAPNQGSFAPPTQPKYSGLQVNSAPQGGGFGPQVSPNIQAQQTTSIQQAGNIGQNIAAPGQVAGINQSANFNPAVQNIPNRGIARVTDQNGAYNRFAGMWNPNGVPGTRTNLDGSGVFYKPDPNSSQVYTADGTPVNYQQYLMLGGKPDFSNVISGPIGSVAGAPTPPANSGFPVSGSAQNVQMTYGFGDGTSYDANGNQLSSGGGTGNPGGALSGNAQVDNSSGTYPSSAFSQPVTNSALQDLIDQNKQLRTLILAASAPSDQEASLMKQLADARSYSQNYITSVNGGMKDVMAKPIPLEFQQGQEAAIQRDAAFQEQANSAQENALANELGVTQQLRLGQLQQLNTAAGFGQQDIQNLLAQQAQANALTQIVQSNGHYIRYQFDAQGNPTGAQDLGPIQPNLVPFQDLTTGGTSFFNTATGSIINPNTGQGVAGGSQGGSTGGGIVRGIDLGAGIAMGPYANASGSDKTNYQYASTINTLANNMPQFQTASDIQQYISSTVKGSPVTGQMIANASNQYGVDPQVLTAVLQQESSFGTKGVGARTFNPGNVGNVNSGGTRNFGSWQAGVNAVAQNLSRRTLNESQLTSYAQQQGNSYAQSQFQQQAQSSQLPPLVQKYTDSLQNIGGNTQFIDQQRVPSAQTDAIKIQSAGKVPFLSPEETSQIKSVDQIVSNLKSLMQLIPSVNPGGLAGLGGKYGLGSLWNTVQNVTQSNTNIAKYNQFRDTAIKLVQGLAGGSGSGLRINGAEIENSLQTLPTIHDNYDVAVSKMQQIETFLNNAVKEVLPGAQVNFTNPPSNGAMAYIQSLGLGAK